MIDYNTGWSVGVAKSVEKNKNVADQFSVKYILAGEKLQKRIVGLKNVTKQGRLRGTQVLGTSCWCKRVNTVEKQ